MAASAAAQTMPMQGHDHMAMMMPANPLGIDHARDGSGTSWMPDAVPMQGRMWHRGDWMLMLHGNGFLQVVTTGTDRGDTQFGSVNWAMGMAQREWGGGQLQLRSMVSAEPVTVGRCGYPMLLQSGESCRGEALHDRQHPHDMFMEVGASYRREINPSIAWEAYAALSGEPALGPTGFPHRFSAMPNLVAPISHHWLDSTHVSFGVVTGGVYGRRWKLEGSAFNGREPDDARYGFDLAALDSVSGRAWYMPSPNWALQVSAGHLTAAEQHPGEDAEDVSRFTASATHSRAIGGRILASTFAWGLNREHDHSSSALLAETALDLTARDTVFARGEIVGKTPADLALPLAEDGVFTTGKVQGGYTRWFRTVRGVAFGAGGSLGLAFLPEAVQPYYGKRIGAEAAVFLNVRVK
jgi:hypothetical protein